MTEPPQRGEWITFHRRPVHGPDCHTGCRPKQGGHGGYAEFGQVAGLAPALFWRRRVYRVRYWHPQPSRRLQVLETEVSADRVIARIAAPPGVRALLSPPSTSTPDRKAA